MTLSEVMTELQSYGMEGIKNILIKHGAKEPLFGVKVEDLKKILKKTKTNTPLAKQLFATGNYDAMYLSGLMANGAEMTAAEIDGWAQKAYGSGISEYTVPWVASENPACLTLALKWIESKEESVAVNGWAALCALVSIRPDEELDIPLLFALLRRVKQEIHQAPNRVRYEMNAFMICAGAYVPALTDEVVTMAKEIGKVSVFMNGTACKVPLVADYIGKITKMGKIGKKRKTAKC
ncbi:MAG TPA: DNA alkylation repair protein [Bacteroidales bacterium]|nr:DNA alkylation repair protein [Bacteroidales bacterium]